MSEAFPIWRTAWRATCPRCGQGHMFQGFLDLRDDCEVCHLDYGFADSGDGPAVFVTLLAGFVVVAAALFTEFSYHPPYWVHAVLWLPLGILVPLGMLRPLKAWLIAAQYRHAAREGRLESLSDGTPPKDKQ